MGMTQQPTSPSQQPRWIIEPVHVVQWDQNIAFEGYCVTRTDRPNHFINWAKGDLMILPKDQAQGYADRLNKKSD